MEYANPLVGNVIRLGRPAVNVADPEAGMLGTSVTVSVNDCVPAGAVPFDATIVRVMVPVDLGVPDNVAVPAS